MSQQSILCFSPLFTLDTLFYNLTGGRKVHPFTFGSERGCSMKPVSSAALRGILSDPEQRAVVLQVYCTTLRIMKPLINTCNVWVIRAYAVGIIPMPTDLVMNRKYANIASKFRFFIQIFIDFPKSMLCNLYIFLLDKIF